MKSKCTVIIAMLCSSCGSELKRIEVDDLFNPVSSKQQYYQTLEDQEIVIQGRVDRVSTSWLLPAGYVTLILKGTNRNAVVCGFAPDEANSIRDLSENSFVVVKGKCQNDILLKIPFIMECKLIRYFPSLSWK